VVTEILEAPERLEFEHLLQWLRLSFMLAPLLVLIAFGEAAVMYAVWIAIAVALSFIWVGLLLRCWPEVLLKSQLWLRVADCALVYLVLVNYHAFLRNAYYDAVYLLFVVAAAATHGRRGAWAMSGVAGLAVLASRLQLIATGAVAYEVRHLTDAVFYTVFFLGTATAVAFLMHKTADGVTRRESALRAELSNRNTELERTTHELAESIQFRDAMLTGVTHDLKTPLTVIKVQSQLLRRRADEGLRASIDQIDRASTRMARWIDELLEVATVRNADDMHLALQPTDLVKLARDVVDEHAQSSRRHQLVLETDAPEIIGRFDAPRLERVLDNLLGNAVKYSPDGGCVKLELRTDADWAIVTVRDQGLGIPAEDLPHIFEPFRRGGNVVGRISGTGIGLASAQRIVERHGGEVVVDSTPGDGSSFTIRLPLAVPVAVKA
jgi:signal transduction histidine kinase